MSSKAELEQEREELLAKIAGMEEALEVAKGALAVRGPISETKPSNMVVLTPMHATVSYERKVPKEQFGSETMGLHVPFEVMTEWWAPEDQLKDPDRGAKELHKATARAQAFAKIAVLSALGVRWDWDDAGRVMEVGPKPQAATMVQTPKVAAPPGVDDKIKFDYGVGKTWMELAQMAADGDQSAKAALIKARDKTPGGKWENLQRKQATAARWLLENVVGPQPADVSETYAALQAPSKEDEEKRMSEDVKNMKW